MCILTSQNCPPSEEVVCAGWVWVYVVNFYILNFHFTHHSLSCRSGPSPLDTVQAEHSCPKRPKVKSGIYILCQRGAQKHQNK